MQVNNEINGGGEMGTRGVKHFNRSVKTTEKQPAVSLVELIYHTAIRLQVSH